MTSMKLIKRRIASVSSTKQIMKAMDLVAASKLQKAKAGLDFIRPLVGEIKRVLGDIRIDKETKENIFVKGREVKNTAFVVITSDRGLCGGYNVNLSKEALSFMNKGKNEKIIAVGAKGWEYFRRRRKNILCRYDSASEAGFYEDAQSIGEHLISLYQSGEIDEAYVAYTRFESMLSHVPHVAKILPIGSEALGEAGEANDAAEADYILNEMKYDPDVNTFLAHAVPMYVNLFVYGAMVEAAVCEQASRMLSMDMATNNATEIIDELTLTYNRIRQSTITQEINEIVSGANALQ